MFATTELRDQVAFQRKLNGLIGFGSALRLRSVMVAARLGRFEISTLTMRPHTTRHPVLMRPGSTDLDVYRQVLAEEQYGVLNDLDPEVIVDCGANVGYASAYFLSRFPRARVVAIEPFPTNAALCRRNLKPYGGRVELYDAAVWSRCGRLAVDRADPGNEWGVTVRATRPGERGDFDAIDIPSLGLARIDLLKIDIEGSEIELFDASSAAWLPHVGNIAIELHGEACERAFFDALLTYHFELRQVGELTVCRNLRPRA